MEVSGFGGTAGNVPTTPCHSLTRKRITNRPTITAQRSIEVDSDSRLASPLI